MVRPLLLSGFMGTGKTAVGRALATERGMRFLDLDALIEATAGATIADIFATRGEAAFRVLERDVLLEQLELESEQPTVISLGGGALLDRTTRVEVLMRSVVVVLSAEPAEILRRISAQDGESGARPLLRGADPLGSIVSLLAARAPGYAECHAHLATDGRQPLEIAHEAYRVWQEDAVVVAAGEQSYRVRIGSELIAKELGPLLGRASGTLLVTDSNVAPLHGHLATKILVTHGVKTAEVVLTPGEEHKNLEGMTRIFQAAFDAGMDRKATFVGLGGGVVTDMTGFAAACWVRGVRWVGLPTTLLSMVDASVGGKTGVDFGTAKNAVGAFWQPSGVLCDVQTLLTESERAYVGALSEVVKTALIGDPPLLDFLEANSAAVLRRDLGVLAEVVERCIRVKARIVALDEREAGLRATLNLGHTIGHALEAASGYTGLTHGEAVSLGLVAALRFGERRGHTPPMLTARILELLKRLGLPYRLQRSALLASVRLIGHDKKRAGTSVRFVYAAAPGNVFGEPTSLSELEAEAPELADP